MPLIDKHSLLSNPSSRGYEESFCFVFPCYEIRFVLEKAGA
jgi:hypothetical protein